MLPPLSAATPSWSAFSAHSSIPDAAYIADGELVGWAHFAAFVYGSLSVDYSAAKRKAFIRARPGRDGIRVEVLPLTHYAPSFEEHGGICASSPTTNATFLGSPWRSTFRKHSQQRHVRQLSRSEPIATIK